MKDENRFVLLFVVGSFVLLVGMAFLGIGVTLIGAIILIYSIINAGKQKGNYRLNEHMIMKNSSPVEAIKDKDSLEERTKNLEKDVEMLKRPQKASFWTILQLIGAFMSFIGSATLLILLLWMLYYVYNVL